MMMLSHFSFVGEEQEPSQFVNRLSFIDLVIDTPSVFLASQIV
jgi:hypothetical protein